MSEVTTLPSITVQHDLHAVEADVRDGGPPESAWISCYPGDGGEGVHGKVLVDRDDREALSYTATDGVEVSHVTNVRRSSPAT
jgi:hypothetical protein